MNRGQQATVNYKYANQGVVLKNAREATDLTQADVAEQLGFTSPQYISNCERGLCKLAARHLRKLAKLYGRKPIERVIDLRVGELRNKLIKGLG